MTAEVWTTSTYRACQSCGRLVKDCPAPVVPMMPTVEHVLWTSPKRPNLRLLRTPANHNPEAAS